MEGFLIEENGKYAIDCSQAVWASDNMHTIYHDCGLTDYLCDADFVIETEKDILLIEYKNANIPEAIAHTNEKNLYNPLKEDKYNKVVKKFYGSWYYLYLLGKEKPVKYIFVVEYPKGNATSRKFLRNALKKYLPFKLQDQFDKGKQLIDLVDVKNIDEWNEHEVYGRFPIKSLAQLGG